ncbi:energy-coupling factor transporter transmembrane component T family protein [Ferdinandcohnia quinoae]|uniref:Energy-coupling factor transporter transmembrane protein EcfT n=1 Tax=Fredinandcohnia quinoae TaxID=2918902 RepID=A0AAW5E6D1_9BACI|nr:energy-coupling factor transporter transmembrane component T [Fredinandcohnia sp. SECRCQ15]MCH1627074.1 energy-coupling factor transporter transmembrane protein EcfT [Fredinandcohnia sp. SECRCQ15]
MHFDFTSKETWLHSINPTLKLLVLVGLCASLFFIDDLNLTMNITLTVLVLYWGFTGQPIGRVLLLSFPFFLVFISTSTSMILFGKGDMTWFEWGLIRITEEGFQKGLLVGLRAVIFASLGLMFALTTRPVYLFYSLMQQVKLKPKYAYSFMAGLRLIPIMMEEFQTIQYAMKVRGVEGQRGIRSIYFKLKAYSIPLLSQSIRRAHRIAVAMEAKRFSDYATRTYFYQIGFSKHDITFLLYFGIMLTLGYYVSVFFPYFH